VTEEFPELDPLIKALTAGPAPAELTGEQAAVAMFSAQRATAGTAGPPARSRIPASVRPLVSVPAATIVVLAALTGGAYAAVLPTSIQHIAHRVLARIGVPDAHPAASQPGPAPLTVRSTTAALPAKPASSGVRVPGPAPRVPPAGSPVLLATRGQVAAGSAVTLDGRVAPEGTPRSGVLVQLLELSGSRWRPVAAARTDDYGVAVFTVRHVTANTEFRLAGSDAGSGAAGADTGTGTVLVTVVPRVTVARSASPLPGAEVITAGARYAEPGDLVLLQIALDGAWRDISEQPLDGTRQARFTVTVGQGQAYRVLLLATSTHAASISPQVREPRGNPESARSHDPR
jgi:hypothetical protein